MIKSLHIKNIALIDDAEINFCDELNVLSGETGSGKTVVISSINFLLGGKADKSIIRFGKEFAQAEAVFNVENNEELKELLLSFDIEWDDELILFRKITIDGKSVIKVNGQSINATMLKRIAELICDIYGQSEHYSLLKDTNQLKVLDCFIGDELIEQKERCSNICKQIKEENNRLSSLGGNERERQNKIDLLKFQISEIDGANLSDGEEETLLEKRKILADSEKIKENIAFIHECFSNEEGIYDLVSQATKKSNEIEKYSDKFLEISNRIKSLKIDCQDLSNETDDLLSSLDFDEEELSNIEERLDVIRNLKRKYGDNIKEILEYRDKCSCEYNDLINFEELYNKTTTKIQKLKADLGKIYNNISSIRNKYSVIFSKKIEDELCTLGMKNAKFVISLIKKDEDEISPNGIDVAEFTFSANLGEPLKTMSKIISGGEMSRFMLAMKIVSNVLPSKSTYIFDEIDAGISGAVAEIVAEKFCKLSKNMQVITISHLPQIVSFSDKSYKIYKIEESDKTSTNILELDKNGKLDEIVRIMGNGDNSSLALEHAKEVVNKASIMKKEIRA